MTNHCHIPCPHCRGVRSPSNAHSCQEGLAFFLHCCSRSGQVFQMEGGFQTARYFPDPLDQIFVEPPDVEGSAVVAFSSRGAECAGRSARSLFWHEYSYWIPHIPSCEMISQPVAAATLPDVRDVIISTKSLPFFGWQTF